eukprot:4795450-Alexandrium_andersonii.AAC.2
MGRSIGPANVAPRMLPARRNEPSSWWNRAARPGPRGVIWPGTRSCAGTTDRARTARATPDSRTGLEAPSRAAQALQCVAGDQTDPRAPTSSPSTNAGRETARAATVMRRAEDSASDWRCPRQEQARKEALWVAPRRAQESSEAEPTTTECPTRVRASVAYRAPSCRCTSQTAGHHASKCTDPNSPAPQRWHGSWRATPANGSKQRRASRAAAGCPTGGGDAPSEAPTEQTTQLAPSSRAAERPRQEARQEMPGVADEGAESERATSSAPQQTRNRGCARRAAVDLRAPPRPRTQFPTSRAT